MGSFRGEREILRAARDEGAPVIALEARKIAFDSRSVFRFVRSLISSSDAHIAAPVAV